MQADKPADVTVAMPTYKREKVLLDAVGHLLNESPPASEVLVADQTPRHDAPTQARLKEWDEQGAIRWLRLDKPSITGAMNTGLREASCPIVLFVDDDIVPAPGLIRAHAAAYEESRDVWAVAGQVLQPGEEPIPGPVTCTEHGLRAFLDFSFRSTSRAWVKSAMAGNLSVRRERALEIGGFDENFVGAAYRFETEFCRRVWRNRGKVLYEPGASIRHLRASEGGTRSRGGHLSSPSPRHGVGDYYFALGHGIGLDTVSYVLSRPFREVCTRFHLRRPWWIPVKLLGEVQALAWAAFLAARGPRYAARHGRPDRSGRNG